MALRLEDDHHCFVCGTENPKGLHLQFERREPGRLASSVVFSRDHQGFKGIVHGGMMAAVLDEMMGNLAWVEGHSAATVELNVRLKKAARVGERVLLEGWIRQGEKPRILRGRAEARDEKGTLLASAEGVLIKIV